MFSPSRYLMVILMATSMAMIVGDGNVNGNDNMAMIVGSLGTYLQMSAPLATGSRRKSPLPMLVSRTSYLTWEQVNRYVHLLVHLSDLTWVQVNIY